MKHNREHEDLLPYMKSNTHINTGTCSGCWNKKKLNLIYWTPIDHTIRVRSRSVHKRNDHRWHVVDGQQAVTSASAANPILSAEASQGCRLLGDPINVFVITTMEYSYTPTAARNSALIDNIISRITRYGGCTTQLGRPAVLNKSFTYTHIPRINARFHHPWSLHVQD